MHRPELDGNNQNTAEYTESYLYRTGPGLVNPYSYPCCHIRASDLWCRRRNDVITLRLGMSPYHGRSGDPRRAH